MERVLGRAVLNFPCGYGVGCMRVQAVAEGKTPAGQERTSVSGSEDRSLSIPLSKNFKLKLSDSSNPEGQKGRHSSFRTSLPLPLSLSASAFPSPFKFIRFSRENDEPSRQNGSDSLSALEMVRGVQAGSGWIPLDSCETSSFGDIAESEGDFECSKSVDNSNRMRLERVELAIEEDGDTCATMSPSDGVSKPWMRNLIRLKIFWNKENNPPVEPSRNSTTTTDKISPVESCQFIPPSCGCGSCGSAGVTSGQSSEMSATTIEITPHLSIAQNKEYFSKFLHSVSSSERKRVTQMAYLSNLAYRVATIEEDELFAYYHLKMVTSSLAMKAIAAAAKDRKVPIPEEDRVLNKAVTSTADGQGLTASASLSPGAAFTVTATAASCNSEARDILSSNSGSTGLADFAARLSGSTNPEDVSQKDYGRCDHSTKIGNNSESEAVKESRNPCPGTTVRSASPRSPAEDGNEQTTSRLCCPCEWFVCDNEATNTRFIVIQGTETLAGWQANLRFEPTQFEPELKSGVMVHRGIYEAAKGLYEDVLPMILEHVEKCGEHARIRFTGHSLGGSLAVLLSLMVGFRKAAPVSALLPVYTFGSPCIMCGGNYLLEQLGLPHRHIQNVVMHLDIVPRTFACDYPDHVAGVLKRVSGTFRNHSCLLQQGLLYALMGEMVILQPDEEQAPAHPLLPEGSGLYKLGKPSQAQDNHFLNLAMELQSAERAFLNVPHPLEMLSDRNAYGSEGTISRDHDCRSYLKALQRLQRRELVKRRRVLREVRRQLWAPLLGKDNSCQNLAFKELGHAVTEAPDILRDYRDLKASESLGSAGNFSQIFRLGDNIMGSSSENDHAVRCDLGNTHTRISRGPHSVP